VDSPEALVRRLVLSLAIALFAALSAAPEALAMGSLHDGYRHHGSRHHGWDSSFTSLKDLVGGDTLTSGNGELVFSDFEVIISGSLSPKLRFYKVIALDDGFAIAGPIGVADGDSGDLLIQYTVTSTSPITQATLKFNGVAHRNGSSASVVETYDEPVDVELFVFATGGGGKQRFDTLDLEGFTQLRVTKDILVDAANCGGFAAISWIEQRFQTAPEPAALLLIGLTLAAVHGARRRG
jgi:hypothetical protein